MTTTINRPGCAAGFALALGASSPAFGGIVQVSDPGALEPGPFTLEEFEDEILEPGATYSTPGNTYPDNTSAPCVLQISRMRSFLSRASM